MGFGSFRGANAGGPGDGLPIRDANACAFGDACDHAGGGNTGSGTICNARAIRGCKPSLIPD